MLCSEPRIVSDKERDIASYVLEKTLRISSATLLLSAPLDTGSQLRASLERTSIRLVEDAGLAPVSLEGRGALLTHLRTLGALFETAHLAGMIGESNVSILSSELTALGEFLADVGWVGGTRILPSGLLAVPMDTDIFTTGVYQEQSTTYKRHINTDNVRRENGVPEHTQKDTSGVVKDNQVGGVPQHKERVQEVQKDRRATILGIIQRKDRITVKDVSNVIKDCSEKTIQRELLALVGQGVLVKEGERRWSTYRLA